MKTIITVLIMFLSQQVFALNNRADTSAAIVSAEGTWVKSKVYLKCLLKNQKEDGFLVFEIKKNGVYQYVGNTPVTGVPVEFPLLYCFNYEDADFTTSEFRVTCLTPGKEKISSIPFTVERKNSSVATAEIKVVEHIID